MKSLILFRHGKSDWDTEASDHERPVNGRGKKAAKAMGRLLKAIGQKPDGVVTSSAVRARTTAERAQKAGGWTAPLRVTPALYEATPFTVLKEVRAEPESTQCLLLVGHQPTWSELVSLLVGGGLFRFPTATMARVDLHIDRWRDAEYGRGELVWLIAPRLLTDGDVSV